MAKIQDASAEHPDYAMRIKDWTKIRDCMKGEDAIKDKKEDYLPRPLGMSGKYAEAYDAYIERAHFPLICPYALSGALGVVITKLPEFNVPKDLEYIIKEATKDGRSLQQLFLDIVADIFQTGRVPLAVEPTEKNQFRFTQFKAEAFINWKTASVDVEKNMILAVMKEKKLVDEDNIFSHESMDAYRVLSIEVDEDGNNAFVSTLFDDQGERTDKRKVPKYMGKTIDEIPLVVAGSINNSVDIQPIPLIPVANCSVQIYRKEADLANSEFLSCNPTLVVTGADNTDNALPNVVGSSVMIVIPSDQARVFYTQTDTAALTHVKEHIDSLYEEAIRHGVAILDSRKGVEAAEALRIRQATQSASIYSIYLSAMNAILTGLQLMRKWDDKSVDDVTADAPASLTFGIPDPAVMEGLITGFAESGVIPLPVIHKYLVASGLLDQTIGYEEYVKLIEENQKLRKMLVLPKEEKEDKGEVKKIEDKSKPSVLDDTENKS